MESQSVHGQQFIKKKVNHGQHLVTQKKGEPWSMTTGQGTQGRTCPGLQIWASRRACSTKRSNYFW